MDKKNKFGELHQDSFSIGDIVEWSIWNEKIQEWDQNYGVITDVKNEFRSNRLVSISKVLPMNSANEVEHFTMSLRLVSKTIEKGKEIDS
jgi:hypothetical protein